jgi:GTPase Era involved in 16S rRNA processing/S-ribosylhomocysteine lyase LuxS involved in autoinducer biosynthesis
MHLAEIHHYTGISIELDSIQQKLDTNRFYLAVLGQFKRGKTTLINALLGYELLPTSIIPLTSIITIIQYGESLKVIVLFNDGSITEIPLKDLSLYITEQGNPKNQKNVKHVEISYPSDFLKDGLLLIDTPGVGSVYENNTDTTYSFLPKVDAAIFLVTVDPPISQSELTFLQDIKQDIGAVFIILNKIDYVREKEQAEALIFTQRIIQEQLAGETIPIYPMSAKLALEGKLNQDDIRYHSSRLPEFQQAISQFLMQEKGRLLLHSAVQNSLRLIAQMNLAIELEKKAITTPVAELDTKINELNRLLENVQQEKEDMGYLLKGEIGKLVNVLETDLTIFKEKEIPELDQELTSTFSSKTTTLSGKTLVSEMESFLHTFLVARFDVWRASEERKISQVYGRISSRFTHRANEIISRIIQLCTDLFELKLTALAEVEPLTTETGFYYLLEDIPVFLDLDLTTITTLLPKRLAHHVVLKEIKKKIPELVDRNCGRVRWDFVQRVDKSYRKFLYSLDTKINDTIENIHLALNRGSRIKADTEDTVHNIVVKLDRYLAQLQEHRRQLFNLQNEINAMGKTN